MKHEKGLLTWGLRVHEVWGSLRPRVLEFTVWGLQVWDLGVSENKGP